MNYDYGNQTESEYFPYVNFFDVKEKTREFNSVKRPCNIIDTK